MTKLLMGCWLLAMAALPAGAIEGLDLGDGPPDVPIQAYVSHTGVAPGGRLQLAVVYNLPADHHIQVNEFLFAAPAEGEPFQLGEPLLPPTRIWEDEPILVGKVVVRYELLVSTDLPLGERELKMIVGYQFCSERPVYACFAPEEKEVTVPIRVVASGTPISPQNSRYFQGTRPPEAGKEPPRIVPIEGGETTDAGEASGGGEASDSGAESGDEEAWLEQAPGSGETGEAVNTQEGLADRLRGALAKGSWIAFLIVFIAGFLTSFTPCVYPMIPITIGFMVKSATGRLSGFVLSLFFVLGIAIVYSTLGLAAALGGGVFGAALQSSAVSVVIAVIFGLMGISMLGAFDLSLPSSMQTKLQGGRRSGLTGALVMGGVTGIVASPCVGPVLVVLLAWVAQVGNPLYGFSLLFTFAFGLGVLFLLLGTFVGVIKSMPKAGAWMERVKHYFGWIFLTLALYFLRTTISEPVGAMSWGILSILFASAIGAMSPLPEDAGEMARIRKGIGIVFLVLGIVSFAGGFAKQKGWVRSGGESVATSSTSLTWSREEEAALSQALSLGKPVLIDFTAAWCGACKELDEKTWPEPRVVEELGRYVLLRFDLTKKTPENRAIQTRWKVAGLPTVIVLDGRGQEVDRFFGFRSADQVLPLLKRVS